MALSLLLLLAASDPGEGRLTTLTTTMSVWDVVAQDVNGDGLVDIAALCSNASSQPLKKALVVFLGITPGHFDSKHKVTLTLPNRTGPAFFAEIDGHPPKELVLARPDGATWYRFSDGGFVEGGTTAFHSILPGGSKEPLFLRGAAEDLDGDGIDEWLIPGPYSYQIRNEAGLIAEVPCDIVSEIRPYTSAQIAHTLPAHEKFDAPGDGPSGLAFLNDFHADFSYGEKWSRHKRHELPVDGDDKWDSATRLKDINGDGFPDLVITRTKGTVRMQVVTEVYVASAPFVYPSEPTATFETRGALSMVYVEDVDGDEQLDLIFLNIPFSIRSLVNFFVRGKVSIKANVHLYDGKSFPQRPSFKTSLTVDAPDGREQIAFTMGDFNGDGRLDAAFGKDATKLAVHVGDKQSFLKSKAWVNFAVPTFGVAKVYDLNGNKRDDLVLFHPGGDHDKRIEIITF